MWSCLIWLHLRRPCFQTRSTWGSSGSWMFGGHYSIWYTTQFFFSSSALEQASLLPLVIWITSTPTSSRMHFFFSFLTSLSCYHYWYHRNLFASISFILKKITWSHILNPFSCHFIYLFSFVAKLPPKVAYGCHFYLLISVIYHTSVSTPTPLLKLVISKGPQWPPILVRVLQRNGEKSIGV